MLHFPGFDVSIIPLLLLGLSVGVLSGFTGVGGGLVVTPALIIMGVPVNLAVGTSLFWVFLNSLAGAIIHRQRGNADIKLGICLSLPALFGVEVGVRLANQMRDEGMQDVAILSVSILLMVFIGTYTLTESLKRKMDPEQAEEGLTSHPHTALARQLQGVNLQPRVRFARSGITISIWIILLLGFLIGIITGFVGVGGGFIIVPVFTYVVGIPSILAVGSSTVNVLISSFYGGGRYLLNGEVVIPVALLLLSMSIPGVIFGASVARHVRGVAIRLVLGVMTTIVCIGSIFKLIWFLLYQAIPVLQTLASIATFIGIILPVVIVVLLKWSAGRRGKKKPIVEI